MWFVSCLSSVLVLLFMLYWYSFRSQFSVVGGFYSLQFQRGFFQHIYHIGCAFNLHSIINSGLVPGGQNSSKTQTVFFLLVEPMDKNHKDPDTIDLNVPRRTQYLHNAWKRHQDAVYWVDINLSIELDRMQSSLKGYFLLIVFQKLLGLKTGEVWSEKAYMSPRPPPKISLRHDWTKELGSKVARQPEGEVARQAKFFQPN